MHHNTTLASTDLCVHQNKLYCFSNKQILIFNRGKLIQQIKIKHIAEKEHLSQNPYLCDPAPSSQNHYRFYIAIQHTKNDFSKLLDIRLHSLYDLEGEDFNWRLHIKNLKQFTYTQSREV